MADEASLDEKTNAQNRSREDRLSMPREASKRQTVPVTVETFPRAESDMYFAEIALKDGGFGRFSHRREPMRIDAQAVIRANRDTLYSSAVFDLDSGPTTITTHQPCFTILAAIPFLRKESVRDTCWLRFASW